MTSANELAESTDLEVAPGQLLKQLRLEKGFSLEEVEKATRLPVNKLTLLEEGEFSDLGPSVFVQGYVRRYAKLVGGDPDALVASFQKTTGTYSEAASEILVDVADKKVSFQGRADSANGKIKLIVGAACIVVLAIVLTFMFMGDGSDNKVESAKPKVHSDPEIESSDGQVIMAGSDENLVDAPPDFSESTEQEADLDTVKELVEKDSSSERGETSASVAQELAAANSVEESDSTQALIASVYEEESAESLAEEPVLGESRLEIDFVDECWVDIKDKNGVSVFADIQNSGDNLRLFGQAPFSVMFGNARAVSKMSIDTIPVDVSPQGAKKTLRLTVARPQ